MSNGKDDGNHSARATDGIEETSSKRVVRRRRNEGRLKLLLVAERLFGEHGVDAVSIRQIIIAAKQANNSAVTHHFGAKEDLLLAIFEYRANEVDRAGRRRLVALDERGDDSVRGLLGALLLPLSEDLEPRGDPVFAKFLARLHSMPPESHPINTHADIMPTAKEIRERLERKLSFLPSGLFSVRYRLITGMFYAGIVERSHIMKRKDYFGFEGKIMIDDLLNICAASLESPLSLLNLELI
jgi:AcrR family transcriptional regulator